MSMELKNRELQDGILVMMKLMNNFPFKFKYLDYDCMIIYNDGFYNGYVALTEDDKWYGKEYDDIDINVHGGLTFSSFGNDHLDRCNENGQNLYWIGFDCMHYGDYDEVFSLHSKCNKSPEYIVNEIFEMVHQIIEVKLQQAHSKNINRRITILEDNDE